MPAPTKRGTNRIPANSCWSRSAKPPAQWSLSIACRRRGFARPHGAGNLTCRCDSGKTEGRCGAQRRTEPGLIGSRLVLLGVSRSGQIQALRKIRRRQRSHSSNQQNNRAPTEYNSEATPGPTPRGTRCAPNTAWKSVVVPSAPVTL